MKNILFTLFFGLMAISLMGQIKVVSSGSVKIGDTGVNPTADLHMRVTSPNVGEQLFYVQDDHGFFRVREGASGSNIFLPVFNFKGGGINGAGAAFVAEISPANDIIHTAPHVATTMFSSKLTTSVPLSGARTFSFRNHTTPQLTILANGNVGIGSTMATPSVKLQVDGDIMATGSITPSDKRLKSNVSSMEYGLKEILMLNPKTYFPRSWK